MKTFNIEGYDKIVLFQNYVEHGIEYCFRLQKKNFNNIEKLEKFILERCKPYYDFKTNEQQPEVCYLPLKKKSKLSGKQESYWRTEDEVTYKVPTYEELSSSEKVIYQKN